MILTIDIGNSRLKWAVWKQGEIIERSAKVYSAELGEALSAIKAGSSVISEKVPEHVYALCVAGDELSLQLDNWVELTWQLPVEYMRTRQRFKQLINAYDDPSQHGADRWAALIAVSEQYPGESACVICAGTAITFDLLKDGSRHLGGYILPSYISMHKALISDTEDIDVSLSDALIRQEIPVSTDGAVNQGLHHLLQAGIVALCQKAESELGEDLRFILTGGSAQSILR